MCDSEDAEVRLIDPEWGSVRAEARLPQHVSESIHVSDLDDGRGAQDLSEGGGKGRRVAKHLGHGDHVEPALLMLVASASTTTPAMRPSASTTTAPEMPFHPAVVSGSATSTSKGKTCRGWAEAGERLAMAEGSSFPTARSGWRTRSPGSPLLVRWRATSGKPTASQAASWAVPRVTKRGEGLWGADQISCPDSSTTRRARSQSGSSQAISIGVQVAVSAPGRTTRAKTSFSPRGSSTT